MLFFVPNHRSFLMLIDVSSAGRGREVVLRFATKGLNKWREGARSIERGCFGQTRSRCCGCRLVYTQHSSVENEKKKD